MALTPYDGRIQADPIGFAAGARDGHPTASNGAGSRDLRGISADAPDWSREHKRWWEWQPSKSLLAAIRSYHRAGRSPWRRPQRVLAVLRHRFWSVVTGTDIPIVTQIGGGLILRHPNGIVIHRDAVIGPNCLILQQVTIGQTDDGRAPIIGGHVDIGAGAKIIGPVTIRDHARIGANAVVLRDVPAGATAVGVPAKLVERRAKSRRRAAA